MTIFFLRRSIIKEKKESQTRGHEEKQLGIHKSEVFPSESNYVVPPLRPRSG